MQLTKALPRVALIVSSTKNSQIRAFTRAAPSIRPNVIELEASARAAAAAICGDVAALTPVPHEDFTAHGRRHAACPFERGDALGRAGAFRRGTGSSSSSSSSLGEYRQLGERRFCLGALRFRTPALARLFDER